MLARTRTADARKRGEAVVLKRHRPASLKALTDDLERDGVLETTVVVTFDDGYRGNVHVAKPSLERYEIPQTVFVVSGYVDSDHEFGWDKLEQLRLRASLPEPMTTRACGTASRRCPTPRMASSAQRPSNLVAQDGFRRVCAGNRGEVTVGSSVPAVPRIHIEDTRRDFCRS